MPQLDFDLQFPDTLQGLPGLRIQANDGPGAASAFVSAQGAQLLSWRPAGGRERLYLSAASGGMRRGATVEGLAPAIRGGVPVCFPQFSGRGPLPKHGLVRGLAWRRGEQAGDGTCSFFCSDNALTREHWPCAFQAEVRIALGPDAVSVTLEVHNRDSHAWSFTCALHTYLRVGDIRAARLHGLGGLRYEDAADGGVFKQQQEDALAIGAEVDRVYLQPPAALRLTEPGQAALAIVQEGFADTVVWNPGPELARKLPDFPDDDWLHMLCVEAAHAATPLTLEPGQRWRGSQTLRILPD